MSQNTFFPAEPSSFDRIREEVESFCNAIVVHPRITTRATLILEELFANTLDHGLKDGQQTQVSLSMDFAPDDAALTIIYSDEGHPFNPFDQDAPDLEASLDERRVGGLGVHIIQELCRSTGYERLDERNVISCILGTR